MSESLRTYELHIDDGSGAPRFEPLMCSGPREAMAIVRQMIEAHELVSVEVRLMGNVLFTLQR